MEVKRTIYSLILMLFFESCVDSPNCDQIAAMLKDRVEYNFVLTDLDINGHDAYMEGIDLKDNLNKSFLEGSGWIARNSSKFIIGDTIYKQKGQYSITIRRKKKTLVLPCQCGINVYKDTLTNEKLPTSEH
ncbi:hypothetical protein ABIB62_000414 [Mucilaginibacter sp. UYP25]